MLTHNPFLQHTFYPNTLPSPTGRETLEELIQFLKTYCRNIPTHAFGIFWVWYEDHCSAEQREQYRHIGSPLFRQLKTICLATDSPEKRTCIESAVLNLLIESNACIHGALNTLAKTVHYLQADSAQNLLIKIRLELAETIAQQWINENARVLSNMDVMHTHYVQSYLDTDRRMNNPLAPSIRGRDPNTRTHMPDESRYVAYVNILCSLDYVLQEFLLRSALLLDLKRCLEITEDTPTAISTFDEVLNTFFPIPNTNIHDNSIRHWILNTEYQLHIFSENILQFIFHDIIAERLCMLGILATPHSIVLANECTCECYFTETAVIGWITIHKKIFPLTAALATNLIDEPLIDTLFHFFNQTLITTPQLQHLILCASIPNRQKLLQNNLHQICDLETFKQYLSFFESAEIEQMWLINACSAIIQTFDWSVTHFRLCLSLCTEKAQISLLERLQYRLNLSCRISWISDLKTEAQTAFLTSDTFSELCRNFLFHVIQKPIYLLTCLQVFHATHQETVLNAFHPTGLTTCLNQPFPNQKAYLTILECLSKEKQKAFSNILLKYINTEDQSHHLQLHLLKNLHYTHHSILFHHFTEDQFRQSLCSTLPALTETLMILDPQYHAILFLQLGSFHLQNLCESATPEEILQCLSAFICEADQIHFCSIIPDNLLKKIDVFSYYHALLSPSQKMTYLQTISLSHFVNAWQHPSTQVTSIMFDILWHIVTTHTLREQFIPYAQALFNMQLYELQYKYENMTLAWSACDKDITRFLQPFASGPARLRSGHWKFHGEKVIQTILENPTQHTVLEQLHLFKQYQSKQAQPALTGHTLAILLVLRDQLAHFPIPNDTAQLTQALQHTEDKISLITAFYATHHPHWNMPQLENCLSLCNTETQIHLLKMAETPFENLLSHCQTLDWIGALTIEAQTVLLDSTQFPLLQKYIRTAIRKEPMHLLGYLRAFHLTLQDKALICIGTGHILNFFCNANMHPTEYPLLHILFALDTERQGALIHLIVKQIPQVVHASNFILFLKNMHPTHHFLFLALLRTNQLRDMMNHNPSIRKAACKLLSAKNQTYLPDEEDQCRHVIR
ncbi:MAG: hypothetical protein A3J38_03140 [Gammaproteobacteria bacterium RIFCSPHIGHO2_12_FULL_45_9]|nr:MAG: hypothetical protein A3J38_03140 [Gammaproteobacteria bacterium RIFCSPHIGHO2_12_FULL_45_9]